MPTDIRAEQLISKFIKWDNLWGADHGDDWQMERDYITGYVSNSMLTDPRGSDQEILVLYCSVDDELNNLTLLGIFQEEELIFASVEVDTDWLVFYAGSFPTGMIDTRKPYVRKYKWLNAPEEVK